MPKVTLYSRDGQVVKSLECKRLDHYWKSFYKIVTKLTETFGVEDPDGWPVEYFISNLPNIVEGHNPHVVTPKEDDEKFNISLLNDSGKEIRKWEDVQGLAVDEKRFSFYVNKEWVGVCGNIIATPTKPCTYDFEEDD